MFLKLYLIALPLYIALDLFWLGFIAKGFVNKQIGFLMRENPNWLAAILFYLVFTLGIVFFVLMPTMGKGSWMQVMLYGALFGLVTYATYDLVNWSVVKNWPALFTFVDIAWGVVVVALVSVITYFLSS